MTETSHQKVGVLQMEDPKFQWVEWKIEHIFDKKKIEWGIGADTNLFNA